MATTSPPYVGGYTHPTTAAIAGTKDFAWHGYAVVAAASMVLFGLIWDISWHMSIGRDTFWTPAHLLIQGGGLLAGVSSGLLALYLTVRGTPEEKASAVSFWGFRAPFGAFVSILGCGMMLTSAPFDDWWHNAYGLDVRIISPPHLVLGLGMLGILLGAMLRTLALQNGTDEALRARASVLFAVSSAFIIAIVAIFCLEYSDFSDMHQAQFYRALSIPMPLLLVGVAVAGRRRWSATIAAFVYMLVLACSSWILMLFPATPKLGPIYQDITHYVPLEFPLMLIVPALAIDLLWQQVRGWSTWRAAPVLGVAFFVALLAAQWPFADVMMQHGRNWFFHADNYVYWQNPANMSWKFTYRDPEPGPMMAYGKAVVFAILSSAAGLGWGRWMTRVRR